MSENKKTSDNIFFSVMEKDCDDKSELDLTEMLNEIYKSDFTDENDAFIIPQIINYRENFTVKELLLICDYYGIAKELKSNKCNKCEIIEFLVIFESNPMNSDIVFKRQNLWFYINLMANGIIPKRTIMTITRNLLAQVYEFISQEDKKNEVDELTENVAILYKKELYENDEGDEYSQIEGYTIGEVIEKLAKSKVKDYKSLTNKTLFKFMDMIDM